MNVHENKILYADMINSMQLGCETLYEDEDALLIMDQHSCIYYCAANNSQSAENMIAYLPEHFDILVSHDVLSNEAITKKTGLTFQNQCYHCAYLKKEYFSIEVAQGFEIQRIHQKDMQEVIALYKQEMPALANEEYMGLCMEGSMFGLFHKQELCGFIGVHEGGYGSMGMLEIKENYRRKGFGTLLERCLINEQIRLGKIPYGEIFIENKASVLLQQNVGMEIGKDLTYWFYQ